MNELLQGKMRQDINIHPENKFKKRNVLFLTDLFDFCEVNLVKQSVKLHHRQRPWPTGVTRP